ncbi:MAG: hypothetical protein KHX98_04410 [Limosilactobacillus oris]|nr:hypothetical protein [Limosilactobacillus oris]MBS5329943.1 hypothetical protein [Limosilactobacillus oris]
MTARDNQQDQTFCRAAARFNQDSTMVRPTVIRIAERENQVWQTALGPTKQRTPVIRCFQSASHGPVS